MLLTKNTSNKDILQEVKKVERMIQQMNSSSSSKIIDSILVFVLIIFIVYFAFSKNKITYIKNFSLQFWIKTIKEITSIIFIPLAMIITQSGEMLFLLIEFTIIYLGLQLIEESLNMNKNNMLNHISIRAENLSKLVKEKNPISIKKVTRNIEFYDEDGKTLIRAIKEEAVFKKEIIIKSSNHSNKILTYKEWNPKTFIFKRKEFDETSTVYETQVIPQDIVTPGSEDTSIRIIRTKKKNGSQIR